VSKAVLVIDDEREFCETIARRLQLRGYAARAFTRAEEALESARSARPDVVLLDLKMPGVRPMELLMTIRQLVPGVRVILLTGHLDHELRLEGLRLDSFPYLMKPVAIERLLAAIEGLPESGEDR
jgi:DNA-binding NtrC family response regulator